MKTILVILVTASIVYGCAGNASDTNSELPTPVSDQVAVKTSYFIDVHDLEPGKVAFADVADAHQKDLITQDKFGVSFLKYWVDEQKGKVYCLSKASDKQSILNTHQEAHGLVPASIYSVTDGPEAALQGGLPLFLDIHELGAGAVTAKDVAGAHEKDLAVQSSHKVNFINYWVDEKEGKIFCLSEAPDSNAVKNTHKEAHGLLPASILVVKQGE